jgi:hypothetical protein
VSERPATLSRHRRLPRAWRWTIWVLTVGAVFAGLRVLQSAQPAPVPTTFSTGKVVVVGVTGRYQPAAADRAVLEVHSNQVQAAAVSVRARYIGDCAAAGWATLGAGRRTSVGSLCDPQVEQQRVSGWDRLLAAAAARNGDARLGTLAATVPECVAAVGPGAALAAARPDGTVADYDTVREFVAGGLRTPCPITVVDAGGESDSIITMLADRPDTTVVVTGIGPVAGSRDPQLQILYAVPVTPAGWLTSASTRRDGVVNLTDLTRTLIDFGQRGTAGHAAPVDGAPLQVRPGEVRADALSRHLAAVAALSDAVLRGDLALGVGGVAVFVLLVASVATGRLAAARVILAFGCVLPAAMVLTGVVRWWAARSPGPVLTLAVVAWAVGLTVLVITVANRRRLPVAVVGAAVTVATLTVDAALGAAMQPGSMLNSRPVDGGRWYGFGNVTFAVYAVATLVVAGYLAERLQRAGHRSAALAAVALLGFGAVVVEGWPSMGADFGGVLVLTPAVLWLLGALSGVPITWHKVLSAGAAAALLGATISWLDWRRGAGRSHLGAFVQRVIDGDAQDVIIRKAVAAGLSLTAPLGIGSLIIGAVLWVIVFRYAVPALADACVTLRAVAVAAFGVAVLGTLLNDGGVSVWLTVTASFTIIVSALLIDRIYHRQRWSKGSLYVHTSELAGPTLRNWHHRKGFERACRNHRWCDPAVPQP